MDKSGCNGRDESRLPDSGYLATEEELGNGSCSPVLTRLVLWYLLRLRLSLSYWAGGFFLQQFVERSVVDGWPTSDENLRTTTVEFLSPTTLNEDIVSFSRRVESMISNAAGRPVTGMISLFFH